MARSKTQTTTPVNDSVTPVAATPKSKKTTKTTDSAPASKKASKTTATSAAATPAAATPAAATPAAATPVAAVSASSAAPVATSVDEVEASAADGVTLSLTGDFTAFLARLQQATSMMSSLRSEFRLLERKATRELRVAHKLNSKRKRKAGNRNPSGFVKPTLISDELAAFLGKDSGSEMARTEVTREINAYIREHKLQDTQNGRKINADDKLSGLLKLQSGDELTYFNLQKYMSPHFAKTVKPVATA